MAPPDMLRYAKIPLNNGSGAIPAVGFGTLIADPIATKEATRTALEVGFRHFDCAERYRNEEEVGDAMQAAFRAGIARREDIFVTTKLWNTNHRPERVKPAFDASRRRLQIDTVDCYLIHTPFAFRPGDEQDPRDERDQVIYDSGVTLVETWGALERLVDEGQCKSIGLSDVTLDQLRGIVAAARIKPAVAQVECHPYFPQWDLVEFCRENGIVVQAGAPLGHGLDPKVLDDPVIAAIAQRVHKTPAQVALAWAVQRGTAFLVTSRTASRIQENFDISTLPQDAMREISQGITTNVRRNPVVETGVPGFIPRSR
jgi:diketogulonate reductase-like aldo/keto reductase